EPHACNLAPLDDRRKGLTVIGRGDGVARDGGDVTVREVRLRAAFNAFDNRSVTGLVDRVPSDVRNLERRARRGLQPPAFTRQQAEPTNVRSLLAAFVQPLHDETDAKERPALADTLENRVNPCRSERASGIEVPDPGNDHRRCVDNLLWRRR